MLNAQITGSAEKESSTIFKGAVLVLATIFESTNLENLAGGFRGTD